MGKHRAVSASERTTALQRRALAAAAATASMLLAIGAPVATANPGTGGGIVPNHHTHPGGAVTPTGKLTSTVTPPHSDIRSAAGPTPTVHLSTAAVAAGATPTVHVSTAAVAAGATPTVDLSTAAVAAGATPTVDLSTAAVTTPASAPDPGRPVCAGRPAFGRPVFGPAGQRQWPVSCPLEGTANIGFGANFAVLGNRNLESGSNSALPALLSAGLFGANFAVRG